MPPADHFVQRAVPKLGRSDCERSSDICRKSDQLHRQRRHPVGENPHGDSARMPCEIAVPKPTLQRATDSLIVAMTVGRAVEITQDIIAAAAAGRPLNPAAPPGGPGFRFAIADPIIRKLSGSAARNPWDDVTSGQRFASP